MNIDDMKFGELKQIAAMFNGDQLEFLYTRELVVDNFAGCDGQCS